MFGLKEHKRSRSLIGAMLVAFLSLSGTAALACPDIDGLLDTNCDRRLVILAFGDSITVGLRDGDGLGYPGRLNRLFPNAEVVNLGVSGETSYAGKRRAFSAIGARREADYVVVLEGVNDYYQSGRTPISTRGNVVSIRNTGLNVGAISLIGKLTPTSRSIQRTWVRDVNKELAPYARIDFHALGTRILSYDQLHPRDTGYEAMAVLVASVLRTTSSRERPIDSDLDGAYDYEEARYGSDPLRRDTDGDGIPDGTELYVHQSNPVSLDSDADGLSDAQEVAIGANPASALPGVPVMNSLEAIPQS